VVNPGDIVVGDADGVVFIPLDQVKAVHAACHKKMQHEADTLDAIKRNSYDDSWIDAALENQLV
jgi:regulator of RNase E activity RraA